MRQQAKINSVVMLKELRSSLAKFAETASVALDEVTSDIQRTLNWLHEDRRRHWTNQVRLRQERYVQAKLALKRRGIFDFALTGAHTSALDEKKALAIAERQLREAERRLARTRSWILQLEKEMSDYRATTQGLSSAIDMDIPNARAKLEKMVESLEAYVALAPPERARSVDEKTSDNVLPSEAAPPTVLRASAESAASRQRISDLRKQTPSMDVRRKTPLDSNATDWMTSVKPSEALRQAIHNSDAEPVPTHPDDKVLLAQPQEQPGIVYLERSNGEAGDSGWYIGVGTQTELSGYAAIRVADLLEQCPDFGEMLNLPIGYFVLLDAQGPMEALYDPRDNLFWPSTDSDNDDTSEA